MAPDATCLDKERPAQRDVVGGRRVWQPRLGGSGCADSKAHPFSQGSQSWHFISAAWKRDADLRPVRVRNGESVDRAWGNIEVIGVADEQALVGIQKVSIDSSGQ